jgi:hypothetical protein
MDYLDIIKANKTSIQSVLCADHGFKHDKVDTTADYHRFRQFEPSLCQQGSDRTITLTDGVKAVICKKKGKDMEHDEDIELTNELKRFYEGQLKQQHSRLFVDPKGIITIERWLPEMVKDASATDGTIVHYVSTPRIDPVRDIMDPFGVDARALQKNKAVFYNHKWFGPQDLPIGKNLWLKSERGGVLAKTQYAVNETSFARDVYNLTMGGFLNSFSIGFSPLKWAVVPVSELPKLVGGRFDIVNMNELGPDEKVVVHLNWGMHEYSEVGVPMNMDAVRKAKAMEMVQSDFGREYFGSVFGREQLRVEILGVKGAIPYAKHDLAPIGDAWDAGAEVKKASVDDLHKMCAWYDESAPAAKSSYKLPHHTMAGLHTVWRGVAAAMGALLGARGGVIIPSGDKKAVYNHLAGHYKDFEKTPPEFKDYTEDELFKEFPELYADSRSMAEILADGEAESDKVRDVVGTCANDMGAGVRKALEDMMQQMNAKMDAMAAAMSDCNTTCKQILDAVTAEAQNQNSLEELTEKVTRILEWIESPGEEQPNTEPEGAGETDTGKTITVDATSIIEKSAERAVSRVGGKIVK